MALSIFDTGGISIFGNVFDTIDLNGTELILDADGDSSITIDTDDQFDLKLGGSDIMSISNDGTKTTLMGLAGDYWRIGDAATTQVSLASEDALMVSGDLEAYANVYLVSGGTGSVFINETTNTKMTIGLTINQAGNDNEILAFKSSDVNHGATGLAEIDTYASFRKSEAAAGGLAIWALKDSTGNNSAAFRVMALLGENVDTTKSSAGTGIIEFDARQLSGATSANVVANGNIFVVKGLTGGSVEAKLILDIDGDLWLNGGFGMAAVTPQAQQAHIVDMKTNFVDTDVDTATEIASALNTAFAKFNTLLADLEGYGMLATS